MLETNTKIYPNEKKGNAVLYIPPKIYKDSAFPLTSTAVKISIKDNTLVVSNE